MGLLEGIHIDVNCTHPPPKNTAKPCLREMCQDLLVINWDKDCIRFWNLPELFWGNRCDISNLSPFLSHMLSKPPQKKTQRKSNTHTHTQKTKNNASVEIAKHNLPKRNQRLFFLVGLVGSVAMPILEGLNHFALNWAFNEPKFGELGERR